MWKCNPNNIVHNEILGKGISGFVYPYRKDGNDNRWVIKAMYVNTFQGLLKIIDELVLGFSCDHPSILPLRAYNIQENKVNGSSKAMGYHIYIKMPRMKSDLRRIINKHKQEMLQFSEGDIVRCFYTLASGLEYLHNKRIAHRDIKPENILTDGKGSLYIADIGGGVLVTGEDTTVVEHNINYGTRDYKSPETLPDSEDIKKEQYYKSDNWSLGAVMAELCCLEQILGRYSQEVIDEKVQALKSQYNEVLLDLVLGLLRRDPVKRKTIIEVKRTLENNFPYLLMTGEQKPSIIDFCDEEKKILVVEKQKVNDEIEPMDQSGGLDEKKSPDWRKIGTTSIEELKASGLGKVRQFCIRIKICRG